MAVFEVQVVSELGEILARSQTRTFLVDSIMPTIDDLEFSLLRFVDPYGDTIFNRYQARELVPEVQRVLERASSEEQREVIKEFDALARFAIDEPGRYLKFLGD